MFHIFLLKTLCQLSLYFVFVRLLPDMMGLRTGNVLTFALYTFIFCLSFLLRSKGLVLRLAPILLAGILIPFVTLGDVIFVLVPITAFTIYIAASKRYTLNNDAFRGIVGFGVSLMVVLGIILAFSGGHGAEFLLIALICGIMLSRDLRHDVNTIKEPLYKLMSGGVIVVIVAAALFSGSGIVRRFVFFLVRLVGRGYLALLGMLPGEISEDTVNRLRAPFLGAEVEEDYELSDWQLDNDMSMRIGTFDFIAILQWTIAVLVVIGVICVGIWTTRKIFKAYGKMDEGDTLVRESIGETISKTNIPSEKLSGYSGVVRRYYKRFIKLIKKNEGRLFPYYTSQDLEGISADVLKDNGHDLRSVYIRARYSNETITKDDIRSAKDAYKRLKSNNVPSNDQ